MKNQCKAIGRQIPVRNEKNDTLVEVTVKVSTFDHDKHQFVKALQAEYKLTKEDAGKILNDDWVHISIEPGGRPCYGDAKIVVNTHLKAAGRDIRPDSCLTQKRR